MDILLFAVLLAIPIVIYIWCMWCWYKWSEESYPFTGGDDDCSIFAAIVLVRNVLFCTIIFNTVITVSSFIIYCGRNKI